MEPSPALPARSHTQARPQRCYLPPRPVTFQVGFMWLWSAVSGTAVNAHGFAGQLLGVSAYISMSGLRCAAIDIMQRGHLVAHRVSVIHQLTMWSSRGL